MIPIRQIVAALFIASLAPFTLRGQAPYLVKDINAIASISTGSSRPNSFFRFGSRIFFAATTQSSGTELWSTDGTESGTALLADIYPGPTSSVPSRFTVVNGKLTFNARDTHGDELWVTDGTSAGTRLLADISSGTRSSFPSERIVYHNKMVFVADDGLDGKELWITDGTPAGTSFLKDLVPGANGSDPNSFVILNDLLYFVANGGLWKSDGTPAGTVLMKPLTYVLGLTVAGSNLFFSEYTAQTGGELWVSDGTEAGTHMVMEIGPGSAGAVGSFITPFGDRVLFGATESQYGTELWISDGSAAGTHIVRDINPGVASSISQPPITVAGGVAYFAARTETEGLELWKTDGTEAGTSLVRDILPGSGGGGPFSSSPASFVVSGDTVLFTASIDTDNRTLWLTDGSAAGTRQVKTTGRLAIESGSSLAIIDGVIYFAGANSLNGFEPWKSDGKDSGTVMIANLSKDSVPSSDPQRIIAAGDWVYFDAWDGIGTVTQGSGGQPRSIWRSDGTTEGTLMLTVGQGSDYMPVGRSLFFTKVGPVPWISDGTPEGTGVANTFTSLFGPRAAISFVMRDKVFVSLDNHNNYVLAVTNAEMTAPPVPLGVSSARRFTDLAGRAMFFSGNGLWITDGTAAGTYAVVPDLGGYANVSVVIGGLLYFDTTSASGTKLWKSDGTFEGTVVVKVLTPRSPGLSSFVVAGNNLFFSMDQQLWVSDGTEAGTRTLSVPLPGAIAAAGDRVVFYSYDAAAGAELWVSDGTPDGTHLLRDINPGTVSSSPSELTTASDVVYFTATDLLHGSEVWMTDGTAAGTKLAADIEPAGFQGSFPRQYVAADDRLYFSATTSATGTELWALPLPSTSRLMVNDVRAGEGDAGTTSARFTVTLSPASAKSVTVDYATSDGTALSGSDYDAALGTLTFAAGETTKTVVVPVRGDTATENNETFFLTLRNAAGASLGKGSAFAIIDDDDQITDLSASFSFSGAEVFVKETNNGPRTATNLKILSTATPVIQGFCGSCPVAPQQLAPGATATTARYSSGTQQYSTVTATMHERDSQPSNNSLAWITNTIMAMDALYLTPGSEANVWFAYPNVSSVAVVSSNPAIVSVPATATSPSGSPITFVAHGLSAGRSTIKVTTPAGSIGTLTIDVVSAGTQLRWPGAVNVSPVSGGTSFDKPIAFMVSTLGTAPYNGQAATGFVTFTENGQEIGRVATKPGQTQHVDVYVRDVGTNSIRMDYPGDANFLPMTDSWDLTVTRGNVGIVAGAERSGTNAKVSVRVTGSPGAAPTGTVTVSEAGIIAPKTVAVAPAQPGEARGEITLTDVPPGPHTLSIVYSGDVRYLSSTQGARITEPRIHSVRH